MVILGIETSCDETSAAICTNGDIISNVVYTQEEHNKFGGVVPEVASREHDANIHSIVSTALYRAKLNYSDINAIAVTYGAGLLGALIVGLNYAKGLAIGLNIPFLGINHLEGHLYSNFISTSNLQYPYLCLLVTGGHTQIWEVKSVGEYVLHSNTVDDAAGEAFDKGARLLGLGYPGGPEIERISKGGDSKFYKFSIPHVKNNPLNFSFSGLKTALLYKTNEIPKGELKKNRSHLAASYQEIIIDTLLNRLKKVYNKTKINNISITGGVAANKRFREKANLLSHDLNTSIYFPPLKYCTDNAAMIAKASYQKLLNGINSHLDLEPNPNLVLNK